MNRRLDDYISIWYYSYILCTDEGEENEMESEYDEDMKESARPRRMSEVKAAKAKAMPKASSFFIFSNTNR